MKNFIGVSCLLLVLLAGCRERQLATFYVEGSCVECEALIREAMSEVSGADFEGWDMATSQARVQFSGLAEDLDRIQEAIAAAGFETQYFSANPDARAALPACCQQASSRLELPADEKVPDHSHE